MFGSNPRIVWRFAISAVLGFIITAAAVGAYHGSRASSARSGRSAGFHPGRVASQTEHRQRAQSAAHANQRRVRADLHRRDAGAVHHRGQGGPLSYNAYWKAATSPTPPRTNQDYNRYWQKMQAWQEWHRRQQ
jgi:hypothetical protein